MDASGVVNSARSPFPNIPRRIHPHKPRQVWQTLFLLFVPHAIYCTNFKNIFILQTILKTVCMLDTGNRLTDLRGEGGVGGWVEGGKGEIRGPL